jgi:ubiquinone/menaquinone biosynthesis C-methylase UbiE
MWASGAGYESYIGRWSRFVAPQFLAWLNVPLGAKWLDVGCGTGVLSQTILDMVDPKTVLAIDSSQACINFARKQVKDPCVSFRLRYARALPVESGSCDAAISGLVLNFARKPSQMLRWQELYVKVEGIGQIFCR